MPTSIQSTPSIASFCTANPTGEAANSSCSASTHLAKELNFAGNHAAPASEGANNSQLPRCSYSKGKAVNFLKQFVTSFSPANGSHGEPIKRDFNKTTLKLCRRATSPTDPSRIEGRTSIQDLTSTLKNQNTRYHNLAIAANL